MDISTCTFSLYFQPIPNIRREAFEIEAKLDGYMKPFQIHSVPDEAPFELPRISATTLKKQGFGALRRPDDHASYPAAFCGASSSASHVRF